MEEPPPRQPLQALHPLIRPEVVLRLRITTLTVLRRLKDHSGVVKEETVKLTPVSILTLMVLLDLILIPTTVVKILTIP
jgi:hypothetical protein